MFIATRAALTTAPAIASKWNLDFQGTEAAVISFCRTVYIGVVAMLAGLTVNWYTTKPSATDLSVATLVSLLAYYKANAVGWVVTNLIATFWRTTAAYKNSQGGAGYTHPAPLPAVTFPPDAGSLPPPPHA